MDTDDKCIKTKDFSLGPNKQGERNMKTEGRKNETMNTKTIALFR